MAKAVQRIFHSSRRIARRPGIRRVVQPVAGQIYGLRNRGKSAEQRWADGSAWETAHWDARWLADARQRGLLDPDQPLEDPLVRDAVFEVDAAVDPVTILDVGAGPLTPIFTQRV